MGFFSNPSLLMIIVTVVVSLLAWQSPALMDRLLFRTADIKRGQVDRFVTHGFIHADGQHLLFNMLTLYFFGRNVQTFFNDKLSTIGFILFYLSALVVSSIPDYLKHKNNLAYSSLGASGAVSAVVFASILFSPWAWIVVFVVPMPAIVYAIGYIAYSVYADKYRNDNIGHMAHLTGAVYGWLATILLEPRVIPYFFNQLMHPHF